LPSKEEEFASLAEVREFVAKMGPTATRKVLGDLTGVPIRMSQAIVRTVDYNARQCTAQEFGDPTQKGNVAWLATAYTPRVNDVVWLMKWGNDSLIIGQASGISYSTPNHGRWPNAQVRSSSPPSVQANFVWQKYIFNFEAYDTDAMVDMTGGDTDEIIIWTPGMYHFEAQIHFNDATAVPVMRGLRIGADDNSYWYTEEIKVYDNTTNIVNEQTLSCSADHWVSYVGVPQAVCMWVAQGGTGALGITNSGYASPRLSVRYTGPEP